MTRDGLWLTGHASGCQWVGQAFVRRYTQSEGGTGLGPAVRYTQSEGGTGLGPAVHTDRGWARPWSGGTHS